MTLIGILLRKENNKLYVKEEIFKAVSLSGGVPIGIYLDNYNDYIDLCNGFILPGGDEFTLDEIRFIDLIYQKNKPLLGICLGMQAIGIYSGAKIIDIPNHLSLDTYVHEININKSSKLYKILNKDKILVNSRHKSTIINPNLNVGAKSSDGNIEAIEDSNKKFFMGIQWHPESIINDLNSQKIFASFIEASKGE